MALLHHPTWHVPQGWALGDWRWGTTSKFALGSALAAALLSTVLLNAPPETAFVQAPRAALASPVPAWTSAAPEKDPFEEAKRLAVEVELPPQF
jgi:hypothetical protein